MSSQNNIDDTSSSDESEGGPLWDSTDDSDSDYASPPMKKGRLTAKKDQAEEDNSEEGVSVRALLASNSHDTITVTVDEDGTARSKIFTNTDNGAINSDNNLLSDVIQELPSVDGDASDEREQYEVRRFSSLHDVISYMDHYEQETLTHFTSFSRHGAFGDEKRIPNVQRGRIYFESLKGKCGMPITYDGVPFIHVGRWSFCCHQGVDRNLKQKQQYHQKRQERCHKEGVRLETRARTSKKVNCPAEIYISHVVKFPDYQVLETMVADNCLPSDQVRRGIKRRLSEQYKSNPRSLLCQHWYYVRIPHPWAHRGHPVMATLRSPESCSIPAGTKVTLNPEAVARMVDKRKAAVESVVVRTKEPVDCRVLDKIRELYRNGVTQERDIRSAVTDFVREDLLQGQSPPPRIFRRYNPTPKDIANEIIKAREELRLEHVAKQRDVCASLVSEVAHAIPDIQDETVLQQLQDALTQLYELVQGSATVNSAEVDETIMTAAATASSKEEDAASCGDILLSDQTAIVIPQPLELPLHQHQQIHIQHGTPTATLLQSGHTVLTAQPHHRVVQQQQMLPQPQQLILPQQQQQQQQQEQQQQQQQHTITYHSYNVHPLTTNVTTLSTINGIVGVNNSHNGNNSNSVGGGNTATLHTLNPIVTTTLGGGFDSLSSQQQTTYEIASIQQPQQHFGRIEAEPYRERKINATTVATWYQ